jgi:predicted molibdopterin-dependent oxidoreductase YjgC
MTIQIEVDGKAYAVVEGRSLLQILNAVGVKIPALCHHPALKPAGTCKLCAVEIREGDEQPAIRLACTLKARAGMTVVTRSEGVLAARRRALQNLLKMAPTSERLLAFASEFGLDTGPLPDGCIRCRLCVRVCEEVVKAKALKMEKRDGVSYVVPVEGRCIGCSTCANICPTHVIRIEDLENVRTISIREEVIGRHPLERCEGCGKLFTTPSFIQFVARRTTPHPDVKDHHRYCPTCAKVFSDRIKSFYVIENI